MSEKLLKKVQLLGEQSAPEPRGLRLKRLRNLVNFSRKQFCDLCELNINTLKGWEIGRYGGLPRDGAVRIINAVKQQHIICSLEWLLHGEGAAPVPENNAKQQLIIAELELFARLVQQPILSCNITDDAVSPSYNRGNWVAGKIIDLNQENLFFGKLCIVELAEQILVRKVQRGKVNNYNLFCTNPLTSCDPVMAGVNIRNIALIERLYI